ncbi:MAG: hypothetical protein H6766_00310 [Candidatus Peribacteria bacterium]|nr:MAG: hypothetical protein H6766_00310 [Candidatus Peribacteria bacterium]
MIDPLKLREFHQALMTTPDTAGVDTLITTWVSAGDIDFDIDSNPLLSDVKTNELQAQLEQRKTSPLSLEKKSEIAARYLHLNQELQNKLPSPMTVELSDTGNVIIKSYGQETTFDASQDI